MSAGFYKVNLIDAGLMYAPNFVHGPGFSLTKEDPDKANMQETNGWKWFDTDSEAYFYFGISATEQPWSITPLQAKMALHNAGLLEPIETYIATADMSVRIAWQSASEFRRDSAMLMAISGQLGLTSLQLDELFNAAKQIEI